MKSKLLAVLLIGILSLIPNLAKADVPAVRYEVISNLSQFAVNLTSPQGDENFVAQLIPQQDGTYIWSRDYPTFDGHFLYISAQEVQGIKYYKVTVNIYVRGYLIQTITREATVGYEGPIGSVGGGPGPGFDPISGDNNDNGGGTPFDNTINQSYPSPAPVGSPSPYAFTTAWAWK